MSIDKSLKQHYEMQGGVKNYLGKQKMVKAPKKWKSAPGHPKTELAYITEAEKDALIKMNLHGSMNGKAHKGPSGVISLNGWGDASHGLGGSGNTGTGGDSNGRSQALANQAKEAKAKSTPSFDYESEAWGTKDTIADLTSKNPHVDTGKEEDPYEIVMGVKVPLSMRGRKGIDPREDPDLWSGLTPEHEKVMNKPESKWTIEDKLEIEKWEKAQDWGKIQELIDKGYSSEEIQDALEKGLLSKTDPQSLKTNLPNLRNWVPETGLEKSLINSLMPTMTKEGIKGGIKDQLGKAAFNLGAKKLGLGSLLSVVNPALMLASFIPGLKGKAPTSAYDLAKTLTSNIQTKDLKTQWNEKSDWSKVKPSKNPDERGDGLTQKVASDKDVISEGIKKYTLTNDQRKEAIKRRGIVQNILNQGSYQGNELTNQQRNQLTNYISQIDQYLVPVEMAAYGGRIDKPLTGRSRDI